MPGRRYGHLVPGWRQLTTKELADKIMLEADSSPRELALAERIVEEMEDCENLRERIRRLKLRLNKKVKARDGRTGNAG